MKGRKVKDSSNYAEHPYRLGQSSQHVHENAILSISTPGLWWYLYMVYNNHIFYKYSNTCFPSEGNNPSFSDV